MIELSMVMVIFHEPGKWFKTTAKANVGGSDVLRVEQEIGNPLWYHDLTPSNRPQAGQDVQKILEEEYRKRMLPICRKRNLNSLLH